MSKNYSLSNGIDDGRKGEDFTPPEKDFLDKIGLGLSDEHIKENIEDYTQGYKIGTQQRLADPNSGDK